MDPTSQPPPLVVVTGANGLVGSRVCRALVEQGATVRAVVRRSGSAPELEGVQEWVGDFTDPTTAAEVVRGAASAISTVHPMGGDRETQHRVGVEGTSTLARAAVAAGVERFVHISTAAVYDRSPGVADVDESSPLAADDANDYAVTKRDTDLALAGIDGLTRVLVRPPAVLGPGATSVWNTLRPASMREAAEPPHAVPTQTFAWVHVDDLATIVAGLATGRVTGPTTGACTPVNVASGPATVRDYTETVARSLGLDPVWDEDPAWTGQVLADRARAWGWTPRVDLGTALAEIASGLH